jgi:hypothetical protein
MARIDSKVIFVTTSPRTPAKMIPEIELLNTHFSGQIWNTDTQRAFMELLKVENFFNGEGANVTPNNFPISLIIFFFIVFLFVVSSIS